MSSVKAGPVRAFEHNGSCDISILVGFGATPLNLTCPESALPPSGAPKTTGTIRQVEKTSTTVAAANKSTDFFIEVTFSINVDRLSKFRSYFTDQQRRSSLPDEFSKR